VDFDDSLRWSFEMHNKASRWLIKFSSLVTSDTLLLKFAFRTATDEVDFNKQQKQSATMMTTTTIFRYCIFRITGANSQQWLFVEIHLVCSSSECKLE
jgi:hypothetical protein